MAGLQDLIDALAYGNTQNFGLAQNADRRAENLLKLQAWQAEQNRIESQQSLYSELSKALLGAATQTAQGPGNFFQYNRMMSGGRDIFDQVRNGAPPAFSTATGRPATSSISELMARLGMPVFPQTYPMGANFGPGTPPPQAQQQKSDVMRFQ